MAGKENTDINSPAAGSGWFHPQTGTAMKILVIDSNPLFLRATRNFIDALPRCECFVAASLDEALALAVAREANVVLIDYSLRGDRVAPAAQRLKALAPAARVLLLTEDVAAYRDSCLAAEADGCLARDSLGSDLPQLFAGFIPEPGKEFA
jgi:DNA-binding NarL/FixJ family response regulator